jgi:uncharacterized protein (TIGR02452 family)
MTNLEEELIESFHNTVRAFTKYDDLIRATNQLVDRTLVYFENYAVIEKPIKRHRTIVTVTPDTTFHCAKQYVDGHSTVAVLNFANPYQPGGGVEQGAVAQEECLCRSSNLYASLTSPYILANYYDRNNRKSSPFSTDAVVYSKGVTVFKSDDIIPVKLDTYFTLDVLTCAAPYYSRTYGLYDTKRYQRAFYRRIRNILEVAIGNGVDVLVLGAFGCGAFNNPPQLVAEVFRRLLIEEGYCHYFSTVTFAIKSGGETDNFEVFYRILDTTAAENVQ